MPTMAPSGMDSGALLLSSDCSRVPMDSPVLAKLVLVPPMPPLLIAHCTPTASWMSPEISTMAASTNTWARGTSSWRTMSSRALTVSGSASRTRALVLSSARMRMLLGRPPPVCSPPWPPLFFMPSEIWPRVSARVLASLWRRRITRVLAERAVGVSSDCASCTSLARCGGPRMIRRLVRASAITWAPVAPLAWPRLMALLSTSAASITQP